MTFADPNAQDVIPPTERNKDPMRQDPTREDVTHNLVADSSRPLTERERQAADREAPIAEPVYAPASERVPVDPVPGHRDFVEHPDTRTPERQSAIPGQPSMTATEPSFTRVARPSMTPTTSPGSNAAQRADDDSAQWSMQRSGSKLPVMAFSWVALGIGAGLGVWQFLRWQGERNRPINRIRRQARQTASQIRERVPTTPDAAVQPAAGLMAAILSTLVLWRQLEARRTPEPQRRAEKAGSRTTRAVSRASQKASRKISDADWQKGLNALKERWTPKRLELEKTSISKH